MKLEQIDKNVIVKNTEKTDVKFYSPKAEPFKLYGFYNPCNEDVYKRFPSDVAKNVSDSVFALHTWTSGGRLRFKTDSDYIILKVSFKRLTLVDCMPMTSTAGFDLYADNEFVGKFGIKIIDSMSENPQYDINNGYESIISFKSHKMRDIIINFPLYNDVDELFIGVCENAKIKKPNEYSNKLPMVFYGSSITTGGFATRPGNSYPAILSRKFDSDFINLGCAGCAKGELAFAQYIKNLKMSLFVYDYDFNAPSSEHLEKTHEKFFEVIRSNQPDLPVIMISNPSAFYSGDECEKRKKIIKKTYSNAKKNGDKNVYFIDGQKILNSIDKDIFSIDGIHPNDFGFYCIAKEIEKTIKKIL